MAELHSFLWLSNIPLYIYMHVYMYLLLMFSHSVLSNFLWHHGLPGSSVHGSFQARILVCVAIYTYTTSLVVCLSVKRHLGCFHILATVNSADINTGLHVPFWISMLVFSGYIPKGGSARFHFHLVKKQIYFYLWFIFWPMY